MPLGSEFVVMLGLATTTMDKAFAGEVLPALSLTVTLNVEVPVALGVPLMTPVDEFRDRPAGSNPVVTVQLL